MDDPIQSVLDRLAGVRPSNGGYEARCPAHDDQHASLSVNRGEDGRVLLHCHAGCALVAVCKAMGLRLGDLFPSSNNGDGLGRVVATYDYCDSNGGRLFQVLRYEGKKFRQRRPDGKGGWIRNLKDVGRVLYRLPELLAADPTQTVFVVEGERDADNLGAMGLIATTCPGGAGKWHLCDDRPLPGRRVVILPDADEPGRKHADQVARALYGKVTSVKVLSLPGLPEKGDISDWLAAGGTVEELLRLAAEAPEREPAEAAGDPDSGLEPLIEPYRPFPLEVMPERVRAFVVETAAALGCDLAFVALPALSVLGSAIGTTRAIALKDSWCEWPVIWTGVVQRSGSLKSPAMDAAVEPLRLAQIERLNECEAARADYETQSLCYDKRLAEWKRDKKSADPPTKPEQPAAVRYVVGDCTTESLVPILLNNPRGVLLVRDELSGWLRGFDQYKARGGGDVAAWLEFWRAGTLTVDRKTGDHRTMYVRRAAVSACGTIQPGVLTTTLTAEHFDCGLAARLLLANPPERVKRWNSRAVSRATIAGYEQVIRVLLALQHAEGKHGPEPIRLPLDGDALALWSEWYNRHAQRLADAGDDREAAALAKIEAYAARFALIFALAETPDPARISGVSSMSMRRGAALADWFAAESRRVYSLIAESDDDRERRGLVDWIRRRGGTVTVRDLTRGVWRFRGGGTGARQALAELAEAEVGRWVHEPTGKKGGRPVERFELLDNIDIDKTVVSDASLAGFVDVDAPMAQGFGDEPGENDGPPLADLHARIDSEPEPEGCDEWTG